MKLLWVTISAKNINNNYNNNLKVTKIMSKQTFKNKNLLVITHNYAGFVKDQVDIIAQYFNHIYVVIRHNPLADISKYLPINYLKPFTRSLLVDLKNKPANVSIFITNIIYAPTNNQYKELGNKHFKAVERVLQKYNLKFDLIHAHFTWTAGYAGAKLKEIYNTPFIITAHGYDIYDLPFRDSGWRKRIEYVLNTADQIITVSNKNLHCINQLNVRTPVSVIPNGFRSDLFYPEDQLKCRKILGLPEDKKILLTVGNLVPIKGHIYLVEAMKEIKKRQNVICVIIGAGQQKHNLEKLIGKYELGDYVLLFGAKPHHEIPAWMNACDLFIMPSLRESFGVVQIEAMACGKPVVATRNGGSDEIITSDNYGVLCEPANPSELVRNISIALNKEWDHKSIAKYNKKYDWENAVNQIKEIYELLID